MTGTEGDRPQETARRPIAAAVLGRCPRCGRGRLFSGYLSLAPACTACHLDYTFIDSGDGPAFFVMSFVGLVVVVAALTVEVNYAPPLWLHMVLWAPLTVLLSLGLLRPAKGAMIGLQYRFRAAEGRLAGRRDGPR